VELHEALASKVDAWREAGYPSDIPVLAEILEFAVEGVEPSAPWPQSGRLRFLRAAQLRALETYWYLRVVERTPPIPELYRRLFSTTSERLAALGLDTPALTTLALDVGYDGLLERIRTDDVFVKAHKLGVLRETLTLDYPSYILGRRLHGGDHPGRDISARCLAAHRRAPRDLRCRGGPGLPPRTAGRPARRPPGWIRGDRRTRRRRVGDRQA
jgi:hypothetical protein